MDKPSRGERRSHVCKVLRGGSELLRAARERVGRPGSGALGTVKAAVEGATEAGVHSRACAMTTSTESRSGRPLYADRLVPLMASAIRPKRVAQLSHPERGATSRQAKLMVSTVNVVAVDGMRRAAGESSRLALTVSTVCVPRAT